MMWRLPAVAPQAWPLRMALLSVVAVAMGELGVLRTGAPSYDVSAASRLVARAQADGQAVAMLARYHGEFTFRGRLQEPIRESAVQLTGFPTSSGGPTYTSVAHQGQSGGLKR